MIENLDASVCLPCLIPWPVAVMQIKTLLSTKSCMLTLVDSILFKTDGNLLILADLLFSSSKLMTCSGHFLSYAVFLKIAS